MTLPQHSNPHTDRAAHAPYNFVALPDGFVLAIESRDRDRYYPDRFTGVIHCTLTTMTPLYTRAALEQDERGQKQAKDKADFFYINPDTKQPVIPGSGLRGVLRSLVEIITFSKPQPITDRQLFFRTLDTNLDIGKAYAKRMSGGDFQNGFYPLAQAGYMERTANGYRIRPAQELEGTQFYRVEEELAVNVIPGLKKMTRWDQNRERWVPNTRDYQWLRKPVWFKPTSLTHMSGSMSLRAEVVDLQVGATKPGNGWVQGWFIAGGWVPSAPRKGKPTKGKRRHWIVGPAITDERRFITVDEIDIDAYQEDGAGRSQTIEKQKMSVLPEHEGDLIPCFYTFWEDTAKRKRIAFGHTAMFRLPYEYSPRDLLPYREEQWQTTDFAEAIFGWVDDAKGRTIAGRVSVSDAHVIAKENGLFLLNDDEALLRPLLSGPKPTSFQHYLTQESDRKAELHHYQDKGKTTLRGHKLYWHKDDQLQRSDYHQEETSENKTQLTVMRPVDKGVTFAFDLRFENLAAEELGALLWVMRVAGDGKHCLKVGMAKPLGLGSVSVAARLCLSGRVVRYRTLFADPAWAATPKQVDASQLTGLSMADQINMLSKLVQANETTWIDDVTPFIAAFETYILDKVSAQDRSTAKLFEKLPRIETLLALLRWPGPDKARTKYMQGPNNKNLPNEYRDRPILPTPLRVIDPNSSQQMGAAQSVSRRQEPLRRPIEIPTSPPKTSQSLQTPQPMPVVSKPASLDEVVTGMLLEGTVLRVEPNSVVVDIGVGTARMHIDQTFPLARNQAELVNRFPEGEPVRVWVKARKDQNKIQLTMRGPRA